jgi:hypothetical protein
MIASRRIHLAGYQPMLFFISSVDVPDIDFRLVLFLWVNFRFVKYKSKRYGLRLFE